MSSVIEPKFYVKSGDVSFFNRQKDIFDQLNVFEKEKNERQKSVTIDVDNTSTSSEVEVMEVSVTNARPKRKLRSETKQFRGKESIFKRPYVPPPRSKLRSIPDYQRNPHKWTKYSLGDISQEDMSERSNTAAALAFLRELEARKLAEPVEETHGTEVIVFKSRNKVPNKVQDAPSSEEEARSSFRSSKLIMPEYIVGQEKKKVKRLKVTSPKSDEPNQSIKLTHLMEDEDE